MQVNGLVRHKDGGNTLHPSLDRVVVGAFVNDIAPRFCHGATRGVTFSTSAFLACHQC